MSLLISGDLRCKNYGTPTAIAGVAPTLDYRFALDRSELDAVTLTDKLTLTRAATAAFTNLGGNLALATANVPRFDHNVSTLQSLGLLVEQQRVNLALRSEEFGTTWSANNASVTSNAITAPDGTVTGDKIVESATTAFHYVRQAVTTPPSSTHTFSVFAKASERSFCVLELVDNSATSNGFGCTFDLSSGAISGLGSFGNASGATAAVVWERDGWYRIALSGIANTSGSAIRCTIYMGSGGSYAGNGTSGFFLWGAQLEVGATASSYTPTTSATVTRTETATVSLAGLPATRTLVEKPAGCATVAGDTLTLNTGYTAERVMIFPTALTGTQVTDIRGAM